MRSVFRSCWFIIGAQGWVVPFDDVWAYVVFEFLDLVFAGTGGLLPLIASVLPRRGIPSSPPERYRQALPTALIFLVAAVVLTLYASLGRFVEQRLAPRWVGKSDGTRFGVVFAVIAAIMLSLQLTTLVLRLPFIPLLPFGYCWIALVALIVPYLFRVRNDGVNGCVGVYVVAVIFGGFLCFQ